MDRHYLAYAGLAAVHADLAIILALEGAFVHATCVLAVAAIYAVLCRR